VYAVGDYKEFIDCSCGQEHTLPVFQASLGSGAMETIPAFIRAKGLQKPLLLADPNTWKALGKAVQQRISDAGIESSAFVYSDEEPAADEHRLGELLIACAQKPDCMVSAGSGTLTDITRYVCYLLNIPHVAAASAPSMDGYASSVAPLIRGGAKITFGAKAPDLIVGDPTVLAAAPEPMVAAGFGDLMGKLTAKADWLLGHYLHGEAYCPNIQALVDQAVHSMVNLLEGGIDDRGEYVTKILEGLVHSGAAITLFGFSRPASGAEHHLSHYWEMAALREGRVPALHGLKVGYGTWLILQVYEGVRRRSKRGLLPKDESKALERAMDHLPSAASYAVMARKAQVPLEPELLHLSETSVRTAVKEAMAIRDRYTILPLAASHGWLPEIAAEIAVRWE